MTANGCIADDRSHYRNNPERMSLPKILIITASTRQGRFADTIVTWFSTIVAERTDTDYQFIDLRDWMLPYLSQPGNGTKIEAGYVDGSLEAKWRDTIAAADGFIIVTPEYNHGYPAVLKTALDALVVPWRKKPMAFVSYGGVSGGTRAVEQLRTVAIELDMAPIKNTVAMPNVWGVFKPDGTTENVGIVKSAVSMLDQLAWWTQALRQARVVVA